MNFEFIIVYHPKEGESIYSILSDRLREVLEDNLNEVDPDALDRMVHVTFERKRPILEDDLPSVILGFTLELSDAINAIRDVVDEYSSSLNSDPISHVVRFEDPLLQEELAIRAEELYAIELKLRRVLSVIYLHSCPEGDGYDLLIDEAVQPMAKESPTREQMASVKENQFFHLTFGQYVNLNKRPVIKDLVPIILEKETYDSLRAELARKPIEAENDADFLASLKERMDVIEKMRNAVAHNRRPSKKVTEDYLNALPLVNNALDEYLRTQSDEWRESVVAPAGEAPAGEAPAGEIN